SATELDHFLKEFAQLSGAKILVHGGGQIATKIGEGLGIVSQYRDGRRITDAETLDLVTMVYGGLINKKIVARLQSMGCNAWGITGADGNLIPAEKRPVITIDYGFVGDVKSGALPAADWQNLLNGSNVPVVAPLTHDGKGHLLNTNADTLAQEIAKALSPYYKVSLAFLLDKPGVLSDIKDEGSCIPKINHTLYRELKEKGTITEGMIPKLDNAFAALRQGVDQVILGNAHSFREVMAGKSGTRIVHE
ncbi:MAG: acetylglutamate kinase, partial [Chitinophagaceae bacterium]